MAELIETFERYIEERYRPLETEYISSLARRLSKDVVEIRRWFNGECRRAIADACEAQSREGHECSYMSISLLNTSLINDEPTFQVDFYGREWVYGDPWCRRRFRAEYLFDRWRDFKLDALDDRYYVRSRVHTVEIKSLFWGTLDKVAFLFACYAKYFLPLLEYYDEFDGLEKAERFFITCGTYLDWQNKMFAVQPEIDLLNPDANDDATFQTVRKRIYRNQRFSDLDMRGCRFEDCIFDRFTFENISLADGNFLRCRFLSTEFINVKLAGADFIECYFRSCTFKSCTDDPKVIEDEYFAPLRMYHCFLLGLNFEECDLDRLVMLDCFEKEAPK